MGAGKDVFRSGVADRQAQQLVHPQGSERRCVLCRAWQRVQQEQLQELRCAAPSAKLVSMLGSQPTWRLHGSAQELQIQMLEAE